MPQVSADVHVPTSPSEAESVVASLAPPRLRLPVHVRPEPLRWRYDDDGDGCRIVLALTYAVRPAWVRHVAHEVTQWALARQLRSHLARVSRACAERAGGGLAGPGLAVADGEG